MITEINDNLSVKEIYKRNRTRIYISTKDKEILLSDVKTDENFLCKVVFNNYYIVSYTKSSSINDIPLSIDGVYDIRKEEVITNLSDTNKKCLMYMMIMRKSFDLATILSVINNVEWSNDKIVFEDYLTLGNDRITHDQIVKYIEETYPIFSGYIGLSENIPVKDYVKIEKQIGILKFPFFAMQQDLFLENKRENVDCSIVEYEHIKKLERIKK